jgi:hypothetical protein
VVFGCDPSGILHSDRVAQARRKVEQVLMVETSDAERGCDQTDHL